MKIANVERYPVVSLFVIVLASPAQASPVFGTPTSFNESVNSTGVEYSGCVSADGLEL